MTRVVAVHPAEFPPYQRNRLGRRVLSPGDIEILRDRWQDGWTVAALMRAFGVSRRSVYRYANVEVVTVRAGSWEADFAVQDRGEPRRIGRWQRVAA